MKTIKKTLAFLFTFFVLATFNSCSKSDPSTPDTFVPNLDTPPNQWQNVADATNNFFILHAPPAGTSSGSFDGNANGGSITGHFAGTFNHSTVKFTFDSGTYSTRTFSGLFNGSANPVTMTLTAPAVGASPAVTITLKKI